MKNAPARLESLREYLASLGAKADALDGWRAEEKERQSGASAGTSDFFYTSPPFAGYPTGKRFRSFKEVAKFLELDTTAKPKAAAPKAPKAGAPEIDSSDEESAPSRPAAPPKPKPKASPVAAAAAADDDDDDGDSDDEPISKRAPLPPPQAAAAPPAAAPSPSKRAAPPSSSSPAAKPSAARCDQAAVAEGEGAAQRIVGRREPRDARRVRAGAGAGAGGGAAAAGSSAAADADAESAAARRAAAGLPAAENLRWRAPVGEQWLVAMASEGGVERWLGRRELDERFGAAGAALIVAAYAEMEEEEGLFDEGVKVGGPYGELAKQLLRLENDLGWKMMKERWNSKVAAWREQLKVLGGYQGYLCGPKAHGEVVAEKLLTIHAQLKPKSMTDAFKAAADAWRAALHPLLHPADHEWSGFRAAPRRHRRRRARAPRAPAARRRRVAARLHARIDLLAAM